ncbi:hypothetical protein NWI01_17120 [Nitrobacter winogradskyi]|uniref:Uncharacterized protein n=1 Tax=Nitrobacter winogradskyi TaxID=913 RepID=A0A4Y3WCQ3_NITWI|nr:hypothetical protein NWI01_17120 [Nitrobacter winogradskyi]
MERQMALAHKRDDEMVLDIDELRGAGPGRLERALVPHRLQADTGVLKLGQSREIRCGRLLLGRADRLDICETAFELVGDRNSRYLGES